ncbi:unnamed protein product, partial [Closterium sp. NIES-54]
MPLMASLHHLPPSRRFDRRSLIFPTTHRGTAPLLCSSCLPSLADSYIPRRRLATTLSARFARTKSSCAAASLPSSSSTSAACCSAAALPGWAERASDRRERALAKSPCCRSKHAYA